MARGPKTIRGKVTLTTLCTTALVMLLLLVVVSYGVARMVRTSISDALTERLDLAQEAVRKGDLAAAVDSSGSTIVQVVDATGKVIAASESAQNLSSLSELTEDGEKELDDDFEFEIDDDDFELELELDGSDDADGRDDTDDRDTDDRDTDDGDTDDGDTDDRDTDDGDTDDGDTDDGDGEAEYEQEAFFNASALIHPVSAIHVGSAVGTVETGDISVRASDVLGVRGPFLVMERNVETPTYGIVTIIALTSISSVVETARAAALLLAAVFLVLLVVVGLLSRYMAGRTLRPVEEMRQSAEAITASDLSQSVMVPHGDEDLSRLAHTFNDLLARVESAMDAQRQFISNASHELKGPIAATKLMLETARDHPGTIDSAALVSDLTIENEHLQSLVADLLSLARQDEGRIQVNRTLVDLCDLIYEEVTSLGRQSEVLFDVSGVEPLVYRGDARLLGQALRNLLENAMRYARSRVVVSCHEETACHEEANGTVRITVSDDGPGIAPEDRERVFGRFVRLEKGRERATGGTGLGLAVARGIVEQHGGTVFFTDSEIGGATAVIDLPR